MRINSRYEENIREDDLGNRSRNPENLQGNSPRVVLERTVKGQENSVLVLAVAHYGISQSVFGLEIVVLKFKDCEDIAQQNVGPFHLVIFRDWIELTCDIQGVSGMVWVADKARNSELMILAIQTACYSLLVDLSGEKKEIQIIETKQNPEKT